MIMTQYEKAKLETQMNAQRLGSFNNPIVCSIPECAWDPTGDFEPECEAHTRMSCVVRLAGSNNLINLHVDAIEIFENECGDVYAVNPYLAKDITNICEVGGYSGDMPETLDIQGRKYLVVMYPVAA